MRKEGGEAENRGMDHPLAASRGFRARWKKKRRGPVEPSWEGERFGNPPSLLLSSHHSVSSPSAEGRQLP